MTEDKEQENNLVDETMSEGALFVVATPLGNLGDISLRAREVLESVDLIAAEDTRHTSKLLSALQISVRQMKPLHEHNEAAVASSILDRIEAGQTVALVSDAGTPLVSDPGYRLVDMAHQRNVPVRVVPGPCAAIAALSVAGLPTDRFVFEGFLPSRAGARRQFLERCRDQQATMVFYESPHRIEDSLKAIADVFGEDRRVVLCREMTKRFEQVRRDEVSALIQEMESSHHMKKGEIVLVVEGKKPEQEGISEEDLRWIRALRDEMPATALARLAASVTGLPKKMLYDWLLENK